MNIEDRLVALEKQVTGQLAVITLLELEALPPRTP